MSNTPTSILTNSSGSEDNTGSSRPSVDESQEKETQQSGGGSQAVKKSKRDGFNTPPASGSCVILSQDSCLLLEYATVECVPVHVRQLLQHYEQRKLTQAELLFLLVYIVALESGYATERDYEALEDQLQPVPIISYFHLQNVRLLSQEPADYRFEFDESVFRMQLHSILEVGRHNITKATTTKAANLAAEAKAAESHLLQSRLMAIISGDLLIVTLSPSPPTTERGFSVCLPIGRYVLNTQAKQKPIFHRFRKLDELSMQLRDKIFQPLRAQQLALLDAHIYPTLLGLPAELYDEIFRHLNKNQLNIVANVNRHLNYYSRNSKHRMRN